MPQELNIIKDAIETLIGYSRTSLKEEAAAQEKGEHALNVIATMRYVDPDQRMLQRQNAITVEGLKRRIECLILDFGKVYPMVMEKSDRNKLDLAGNHLRDLSAYVKALHADLSSRQY